MDIDYILMAVGVVFILALAFVIRTAIKLRDRANAQMRAIDEWVNDAEKNKK